MLIEKLKITDHPAIGTVELDFCDDTGEPASMVVIAGQNGTGKTVILEAIQSLFEQSSTFPCRVDADLIFIGDERGRIADQIGKAFGRPPSPSIERLHVCRDPRAGLAINDARISPGGPFGVDNGRTGFALRTFYSGANVLYLGSDLQTVSAGEIDRSSLLSYRGGAEGQYIPELLLALEFQDASALKLYAEQNPSVSPIGAVPSLLQRFRNAFAVMFPTKRFNQIRSENGRFHIIFEEHGVETTIHQLSTGEKQVVFRASFFIRDAGIMQNDVVLIDEPELSLSPDWQSKILPFYAETLSINGAPHPQIICATHSPFIVHSANAGKVIVLQRTTDGRVEEMPEPVFPGTSSAIAVRAFNLDRFVREAQPGMMAVITEGETDHLILEAAWGKLYSGRPMPFQIRPGTGAGPLQNLLNSPALPTLIHVGKIVGLFDFDDAWNQWYGVWKKLTPIIVSADDGAGHVKRHPTLPAWAMLLPVPAFRPTMASSAPTFRGRSLLSIEFMFPDAEIPPRMFSEELQPGGGRLPIFRDRYKREFAESVGQIDAAHFTSFQPLFDRLLEIHRVP